MADHISKNQLKTIRLLQQKKHRDASGLFVAEGRKLIDDLRTHFELELLIDEHNATPQEIEQISGMRTPQGVIGVFRQRSKKADINVTPQDLVLVLDDVQDPGNLGTIIRTADWFGVHTIICSHATADCYNPKVVQATMGALGRVKIFYTDIDAWLKEQHNKLPFLPIYGTLLDGKDIYTQTLSTGGIIIMGNEGNGISMPVRKHITCPLLIPSYPKNADTSESLNVGIATAITLAEFRRRH